MRIGTNNKGIKTEAEFGIRVDLRVSLPNELKITHPEKSIWDNPKINKQMLIEFFLQISPLILPFLKDRLLTTIRFPHGIPGESFYQKNCPDYAPEFITRRMHEGINYIICNDLPTLIWLGNQLAIEYHVPFQTYQQKTPLEIVFDLDPPNKDAFSLAVKAAQMIKTILESFQIISFPKLSGNKGIQIHIPIINNDLTYDETRVFTHFIAQYLVEKCPDDFTIERMKKNRGGRLYIDYIQHAEGKTIICPYSTRGNEHATVAAPLYWEEIDEELKSEKYNIPFILNRIKHEPCPFKNFFKTKNPMVTQIISTIRENSSIVP